MKQIMVTMVVLIMAACSHQGSETVLDGNSASMTIERNQSRQIPTEDAVGKRNVEEQQVVEIDRAERKIIYTAHLQIVVSDYDEAENDIEALVDKKKGYIVSSNVKNSEETGRNGSITVRIPQESFQAFLDEIAAISDEVTDQSITSEDVTEEYVDLEARLKAKEVVKARLESLMEQAETTKDLLDISEQLGKVQEEIEQIQGRINYLTNRSDDATVTISITERSLKSGEIETDDLQTWARASQLFVKTINAIVSSISALAVVLIGLSPVIIPLAAAAGWIFYVRRKKKKTKHKADNN